MNYVPFLNTAKQIELSEIITKKHLERTGITFKSTPELLNYFKAQKEKSKKEVESIQSPAITNPPVEKPVESEPKDDHKEIAPVQA